MKINILLKTRSPFIYGDFKRITPIKIYGKKIQCKVFQTNNYESQKFYKNISSI